MSSHGYRSCRTYTDAVRQSAVAMVQAGTPISAVAETLAIPRRSLVNWVKRAERQPAPPVAPASDTPSYEDLPARRVRRMCQLLGVPSSSYYAWRTRQGRPAPTPRPRGIRP